MLQGAAHLARLGLPVILVGPRDDEPSGKGALECWKKEGDPGRRVRSPEEVVRKIRAIQGQQRSYGVVDVQAVAIPTGAASGLLILDWEGMEGTNQACHQFGLRRNVTCGTPSRGVHVLVSPPTDGTSIERQIKPEPGLKLDVLGERGYAIVYGRSAKGRYEPIFDLSRAVDFENLPDRLQEAMRRPSPQKSAGSRSGPAGADTNHLWRQEVFDFEHLCREHGRNVAVAHLTLRKMAEGRMAFMRRHADRIIETANKATDGLNAAGKPEEYTQAEFEATQKTIGGLEHLYGLFPAVERAHRRLKKMDRMPDEWRRIIETLLEVVLKSARAEFSHAHRTLAKEAGILLDRLTHMRYRQKKAWDRYVGQFFKVIGRTASHNGTCVWRFVDFREKNHKDEEATAISTAWLQFYARSLLT